MFNLLHSILNLETTFLSTLLHLLGGQYNGIDGL